MQRATTEGRSGEAPAQDGSTLLTPTCVQCVRVLPCLLRTGHCLPDPSLIPPVTLHCTSASNVLDNSEPSRPATSSHLDGDDPQDAPPASSAGVKGLELNLNELLDAAGIAVHLSVCVRAHAYICMQCAAQCQKFCLGLQGATTSQSPGSDGHGEENVRKEKKENVRRGEETEREREMGPPLCSRTDCQPAALGHPRLQHSPSIFTHSQ